MDLCGSFLTIYLVITDCRGSLWVAIERCVSLSIIYWVIVNCFGSFWVVVGFWVDVFGCCGALWVAVKYFESLWLVPCFSKCAAINIDL